VDEVAGVLGGADNAGRGAVLMSNDGGMGYLCKVFLLLYLIGLDWMDYLCSFFLLLFIPLLNYGI